MITVHKYPLDLVDLQAIEMPEDAHTLTVQVQHDVPVLWARVDTDKPTEQRLIRIVGTGNPMPEYTGPHIGTFQMDGGRLVLHVFEG